MPLQKYILKEDSTSQEFIPEPYYFHGTRSLIPFEKFDKRADGTGVVSGFGTKYGGTFVSSEKDTAEYFTEYLVCKVKLNDDVHAYPYSDNPTVRDVLDACKKDNKMYAMLGVYDGQGKSDVIIIPHTLINKIEIMDWMLVGDKQYYFESLKEMFGQDDSEYYDEHELLNLGYTQEQIDNGETTQIIQDFVDSFFSQTGGGLEYTLKSLPEFKEFYDSL